VSEPQGRPKAAPQPPLGPGSSEDRPDPLLQLALARWRSFYRDPGVLFWTVGFPILLAIVLGVAFRARPDERLPIAVVPCAERASLVVELEAAGLAAQPLPADEAARALRSGRVALSVAREAAKGPVRFAFDPGRAESRLARALAHDALERAAGRQDLVAVEERVVTEPGARYIDFLIPGLIGLNLLNGGLWGIGYVVVDLRTRRLLRRLAATPMRRWHFLLSFGTLRSFLLFIELPLVLAFARLAFGVPLRGGLLAFSVTALIGALAFAAVGLLVAARAPNTQSVAGLINLVSLPMTLGSGVFFPVERFPEALRRVVALLPLTALNDALRAIMLDGAGLLDVARPLGLVAGCGAVAYLLALILFNWR
jgi:ABC-2 type transport system permease protein